MLEVYGIVINCSQYKDYDAIIDLLTDRNIFPIWVRGAYKPNSKYTGYLPLLTRGKYEVYTGGYKHNKLRDAVIDNSLIPFYKSEKTLVFYSMIKELFTITFSPDITNKFFNVMNEAINQAMNHIDLSFVTLIYLANLIKIIGYGLNVENHKNAVAIDFSNGCFVGKEKYDELSMIYLEPIEVELIHDLFTLSQTEMANKSSNIKTNIKLIKLLCDFIIFYNGVEIESLDYLKYLENTLIEG